MMILKFQDNNNEKHNNVYNVLSYLMRDVTVIPLFAVLYDIM